MHASWHGLTYSLPEPNASPKDCISDKLSDFPKRVQLQLLIVASMVRPCPTTRAGLSSRRGEKENTAGSHQLR